LIAVTVWCSGPQAQAAFSDDKESEKRPLISNTFFIFCVTGVGSAATFNENFCLL
jgi:hypothetical protein